MKHEDFIDAYKKIVEKAMYITKTSRMEGLVALDEMIDENKCNQREIMEFGLRLVTDGTDPRIIDKILSNIINLETDNDKKTLKNIQKEAVLAIQEGMNPRMLLLLLNSYVNIEIEETMKKYNEIY